MKPINDTFQIEIEEDGTITIITGRMGVEVHKTAEEFLAEVTEILGAERITEGLPHSHGHGLVHTHGHKHLKH